MIPFLTRAPRTALEQAKYVQALTTQNGDVYCLVAGDSQAEVLERTDAVLKVFRRPACEQLISDLWDLLAEWSQKTFGPDCDKEKVDGVEDAVIWREADGVRRPMRHLKEEAQEVIDEPFEILEHADCLMLVLDAARRAGFSLDQLLVATAQKLAINKQSEYGPPDPVTGIRHRIKCTCRQDGNHGIDSTGCPIHSFKAIKVRIADGETKASG